jgi:hypothetical protein
LRGTAAEQGRNIFHRWILRASSRITTVLIGRTITRLTCQRRFRERDATTLIEPSVTKP